jgi:plastocyanin
MAVPKQRTRFTAFKCVALPVLAHILLVSAQIPSLSTTPIPSVSSSEAIASVTAFNRIHTISVGLGGFKFTPDSIQADVGDTVMFEFYPPDHSVARAEYLSQS